MIRGWPFLRALVDDVEMVLATADLAIAARYARLAGKLGAYYVPIIQEEFDRTVANLLALKHETALARLRAGAAAVDPATQSVRRPDESAADRSAGTVARRGAAGQRSLPGAAGKCARYRARVAEHGLRGLTSSHDTSDDTR